jgi:redox-sensitive bicupin YhaK (pirin superfamily)
MKKQILGTHRDPHGHWVGDGFPVRTLFSYDKLAAHLSPFLMLDYAGPANFPAKQQQQRGVGAHPHRGFETVTIVYQGEVAHRDSGGNCGTIGPGDVQWMTAAGGVLHDEFHSPAFTERGGALEMAQLWVNLPARHKMSAPRYQAIVGSQIPTVTLPEGAGTLRVIAGEYGGERGPAVTFTPLNVWDMRLQAGKAATLQIAPGHTAALAILRGGVLVNGTHRAGDAELVILDLTGDEVELAAEVDTSLLVLTGVPIGEPIVGYGPFVMNSREEIQTAIGDLQAGRFGRMPEASARSPAHTPPSQSLSGAKPGP